FPSVIGGRTYLNLRSKVFKGEFGSDPETFPDYLFARYELAKDGALTLWYLDDTDPLKEALKSGALSGTPGSSTADPRLTGDSAGRWPGRTTGEAGSPRSWASPRRSSASASSPAEWGRSFRSLR